MPRLLVALALSLGVDLGCAGTRDADPLQSPACQHALAALRVAEQAAASAPAHNASSERDARPSAAADAARTDRTATGPRATSPQRDPLAGRGTDATLPPALVAARRSAAQRCLASGADPPTPGRIATPPIVAAPVTGAPARRAIATPPTRVAIPVPPPGPPPLTSITSCDAAGCWTSDGSRLNRVGPTLWGPGGACSAQGTVVHCP